MARFATKPPTELKLSELQDLYLTTRDPSNYTDSVYYQEIFKEMVPYAKSLVLKQTTGKIYLPPEVVEDAAIESTMKFMEQYRKEDFKAHSSFAGYLHFKILETLYAAKKIKEDGVLSLNSTLEGPAGGNKAEIEEWASRLHFRSVFRPEEEREISEDPSYYLFRDNKSIIKTTASVIKDIFNSSASLKSSIKIAIGMILFVRNTKFTKYQMSLSQEEQEALTLALIELKKRLSGEAD